MRKLVIPNRESGQGYADIVNENFSEKTGIVIEVKYAENGDLGIACHVKNCRAVFEYR